MTEKKLFVYVKPQTQAALRSRSSVDEVEHLFQVSNVATSHNLRVR